MRIEPSNDKFPTAMEALKDSVGKRATMNCMVNGPGTKERYTFKGELMHIPNDILEFAATECQPTETWIRHFGADEVWMMIIRENGVTINYTPGWKPEGKEAIITSLDTGDGTRMWYWS